MNRMQPEHGEKRKHKFKCQSCKRKITLAESLSTACRCGNVYCANHRHPEDHTCVALQQIKEQGIKNLAMTLLPVVSDKISNRI